ncbi:MAG: DUF2608 domain-containing protein [Oligoflexia bacterium]|nr:DUF2608 domain-containing protein [Oligoflexia bacterium]
MYTKIFIGDIYFRRLTLILIFSGFNLLLSQTTTFAKCNGEISDIKNMKELIVELSKKEYEHESTKCLLVFDIDETLFTRDFPDFCEKRKKENKDVKLFTCKSEKIDTLATIEELSNDTKVINKVFLEISEQKSNLLKRVDYASMCLMEDDIPEIFTKLQKKTNFDIMALTSRPAGEKFYSNTNNELKTFGIDFSKKAPKVIDKKDLAGIPRSPVMSDQDFKLMNYSQESIEKALSEDESIDKKNLEYYHGRQYNLRLQPQTVMYKDGVYLTTSRDKGKMLYLFLARNKLQYNCILTIDNSKKNVEAFANTFNNYEEKNKNPPVQKNNSIKMDLSKSNDLRKALLKKKNTQYLDSQGSQNNSLNNSLDKSSIIQQPLQCPKIFKSFFYKNTNL